MKENKHKLRMGVFIPGFLIVGIATLIGIFKNEMLVNILNGFFDWSLESFGWLYQILAIVTLIVVFAILFSKLGKVRIGGKDAKPKYSFKTWFAMTLTGGVASGIVTWGVNEPLIYFGNIYGELNQFGIEPFSAEAARFAIGRSFFNWTLIPYAFYALSGLIVAYVYFNKKDKLNVTSTLKPLFGERIGSGFGSNLIDVLSLLAVAFGLSSGLGACITLLTGGFNFIYGFEKTFNLFLIIGVVTIFFYTFSSYLGMDKGLQTLGNVNAYFYYGLLILLIIIGPKLFMARNSTAGIAEWLDNFWKWGLDPIDIGGAALTKSWTLYDWAVWIAYAPVTGIFLAMISNGRTIREFLIVNLILPATFGFIWFTVWGNSAIHMQMTGQLDLVGTILSTDSITALWQFLDNLPFGIGTIIIPINMFIIMISFVTSADATCNNIASLCMEDVPIGTEPPAYLKVLWGVAIGIIAIVMSAFGGQAQGIEGVKALGVAGGFFVLFIFGLQLISAIKMFFFDEIIE